MNLVASIVYVASILLCKSRVLYKDTKALNYYTIATGKRVEQTVQKPNLAKG